MTNADGYGFLYDTMGDEPDITLSGNCQDQRGITNDK